MADELTALIARVDKLEKALYEDEPEPKGHKNDKEKDDEKDKPPLTGQRLDIGKDPKAADKPADPHKR